MNLNFKGKKILVTGGASGIGASVVELLQSEGAKVFVMDKEKVKFQEGTVDIGNIKEVQNFVEKLPLLDGLVLNAALGPFHESSVEIFETNVLGTLNVLKMCEEKLSAFSSIVLVSSTAGYRKKWGENWLKVLNSNKDTPFDYKKKVEGLSSQDTYRLTKWLLIQATKKFSKEFTIKKIRVNCVALGPIKTKMSKPLWSRNVNEWRRLISESPFNIIGKPSDVSPIIVFLLSEHTKMINGSFLHVDGGWFAKNIVGK